jgi:selenocysteine lyase/cysteine desulfurase
MKHVWIHLRLGYVLALPIGTIIAGIPIWFDYFRFYRFGGSFYSAISLAYSDYTYIDVGLTSCIMLLFIIPLFVGVLRILLGSWQRGPGFLGKRGYFVVISHIIISVFISWCAYIASYFPEASGPIYTIGNLQYAFTIVGTNIVTLGFIEPILRLISLVIIAIIPELLKYIYRSSPSKLDSIDQYIIRTKLADLNGEYYPLHGRHRGNFNSCAIAPSIRSIRHRISESTSIYQHYQPGSNSAALYLSNLWVNIKINLKELFFLDFDESNYEIYLFDSTSNAIEICLMMIDYNIIILSPFEHKIERFMAKELTKYRGEYYYLKTNIGYLNGFKDDKTINSIVDELSKHLTNGNNILLISEVSYMTGLTVPIEPIINKIKDIVAKRRDCNLIVAVDGAHSVGHKISKAWKIADIFVFSAHKWLLSEYPAGIAIVNKRTVNMDKSLDVWGRMIPENTANQTTVIGLDAALSWRKDLGSRWTDLENRSYMLIKHFLKIKSHNLSVIGEDNPKYLGKMLAVFPANGSKWTYGNKNKLKASLSKANISCEVFKVSAIDGNKIVVRLSFAYFHDVSSINRLVKILHQHIE